MSADLETMPTLETAKFRAGDVVVLRPVEPLSDQRRRGLYEMCQRIRTETGVTFVVIDPDLDVVVPIHETEVPS